MLSFIASSDLSPELQPPWSSCLSTSPYGHLVGISDISWNHLVLPLFLSSKSFLFHKVIPPPPGLRSETSEFSLISLLLPIPRPTHPVGFICKLLADWAHFLDIFAVITLSKLPLSFTDYCNSLEPASSLTLTPSWEICLPYVRQSTWGWVTKCFAS